MLFAAGLSRLTGVGGIGVPVAHLFLLRKVGLRRAFIPALVGTLVGGMLGAIADPFWAMVLGIAGFSTTVVLVLRTRTQVAGYGSVNRLRQR